MQAELTGAKDIEELQKLYKHFYILTYMIDPVSRMLMSIDLWMPEFIKGSKVEMVKIDSLTEYLNQTGAEINREAIQELVNIPEEEFSGTASEFDFNSFEQEKEEKA